MRRVLLVLRLVLGFWLISLPASAFTHDRVRNAFLHILFDILTLAVVFAPLWTFLVWGQQRRWLLVALIAVVQIPVAIIGFVPIFHPLLHGVALVIALALTAAAIYATRRMSRMKEPSLAGEH